MTRAEFLKHALALAAGAAVLPRVAFGAHECEEMTVSPELLEASAKRAEAVRAGKAVAAGEGQAVFANAGSGFGNRLCITFDDGPTPGVTETVLEELKKRNIRSTFFMIGKRVKECPDLARRVLAEGHELANHTFTHPKLSAMSDAKVQWELRACQEAIAEATGVTPIWFRPPYGAFRKNQGWMARELGLGVALWSIDPRDWARPGVGRIISTVDQQSRPGSIILMHDLHRQTAEAVGELLDRLLEKEFEFARVSGFLGEPYPKTAVV